MSLRVYAPRRREGGEKDVRRGRMRRRAHCDSIDLSYTPGLSIDDIARRTIDSVENSLGTIYLSLSLREMFVSDEAM